MITLMHRRDPGITLVLVTKHMLSTSQIRRSKLESIIHRLSFRHSQEELAGISSLLKDPFFFELFNLRSFEFKKITGMSRYSAEDALAEVYDAELSSSDGEVKLYVHRRVALATPDDVLGTVLATLAERIRDHYAGCTGLVSDLASGGSGGLNTSIVPPLTTMSPPTSRPTMPMTTTTTQRPWSRPRASLLPGSVRPSTARPGERCTQSWESCSSFYVR